MRCRSLSLRVLLACLTPVPLSAQAPANPAYAVLLDDVGTWDAEIFVWDAGRTPRQSRGVEINTLGCNGTCLLTTVQGNLRMANRMNGGPPGSGVTASRRDPIVPVPGVGNYVPNDSWSPDIVGAPGDVLRPPLPAQTMSPDARIHALVGPVRSARTSYAYPKAGKRIVTLYERDPKGREVRVARIVYTRRK